MNKKLAIFQTENGAIEIRTDAENATVWLSQSDIAVIFEKDQSVISRHIKNIFKDREVDKESNMQKMHIAKSDKPVEFYSLDIVLAVGYRTNSTRAISFRKWATNILKQHIALGYTINQKVLKNNKQEFLKVLESLKILTENNKQIDTKDVLSLIQSFSSTFFNLERFDKSTFPKIGVKAKIKASFNELQTDLQTLKKELIKKGEATSLFAQEKKEGILQGIFGNVFQTVFCEDAYSSLEQKAAHLLYFIVKNHPFNDGNKRSGAFAFVWLLQKENYSFIDKISPETLTTLTLLIAISNPKEKDKMIGLIQLLLSK